ncbi:MAG: DUF4399 domain-containing protein [Gemmatimonadota bacterium]
MRTLQAGVLAQASESEATPSRSPLLLLALTGTLACGGSAVARVEIVEPADGAEVAGSEVRVVLAASGVEIAPAADERPGTAHHHLFVDRDPTPSSDTIPAGVSGILHLGRGQESFALGGLAPGSHRVIAILADRDHVPLARAAADTVRFVVLAGDEGSEAPER